MTEAILNLINQLEIDNASFKNNYNIGVFQNKNMNEK